MFIKLQSNAWHENATRRPQSVWLTLVCRVRQRLLLQTVPGRWQHHVSLQKYILRWVTADWESLDVWLTRNYHRCLLHIQIQTSICKGVGQWFDVRPIAVGPWNGRSHSWWYMLNGVWRCIENRCLLQKRRSRAYCCYIVNVAIVLLSRPFSVPVSRVVRGKVQQVILQT